jgi:hypothetical protein
VCAWTALSHGLAAAWPAIPGGGRASRSPVQRPAIIRSALSKPTRAHQPMFDGSVSVVFAGVSPTE